MIQRDIFPQKIGVTSSKPQYALPNIEQVAVELTQLTFTAGTDFTVPAGAQSTSVTIQLPVFPIQSKGRTARFGDSAVTLGGAIATTLATEVAFIADSVGDQGDITTLTNGQYMIDYERGRIYGRRADNATTGTATYSFLVKKSDSSVSISGGIDVASVVPGTGATNLGKAEDAAHTSGDVGVMALGVRKDTAVSLAGTDGDYTAPIFNSTGHQHMAEGFASQAEDNTLGAIYTLEKPTSSSTNAVTLDTSSAAEASSVTKASAGRLYGFVFSNGNGATRYLQFFNSTTVPADATVPFLVFRVATGETLHWEFNKGIPFSTGISWCNSSTQNTKTIGSADSLANIFYA